jgi:alpha-glucosidase (family GH31 glycosyl hydrolase)
MRPMWYEYPSEIEFMNITSQFMIGPSLLYVPKLHSSNKKDSDLYDPTRVNVKNYEVNVTLPGDDLWYNYFSKEVEQQNTAIFKKELSLKEMLLYVRGGTILPIKLHNNRLSLARAFFMPIKLEVYPDTLGKA